MTTKWTCRICSYSYNILKGDPKGKIPATTPFEALPDTWLCPVCGASKSLFILLAD